MKIIVGRLVELIAFLFGLFGGFLKVIAPPEEAEASFAVGLASVISLLVFLALTVLIRLKTSQAARVILIVVAIALAIGAIVSGFVYRSNLRELTFAYPPGAESADYIAGTEYTQAARDFMSENQHLTVSEVVAYFEGLANRDRVWTADSRRYAASLLTGLYVAFVVSVFGAIFCFTEGLLAD